MVLGYPEAQASMRDPRLHRQKHLDKLNIAGATLEFKCEVIF
jgi:hypothetical protein